MWFLFKIHMLRGEIHAFIRGLVFHLVRGSVYLLIVLGNSFSLLYTSLVTIFIYIVLILYIYIYDVCLLHLSLHVLFPLYLYTHVSLCTQSLLLFHTWCLDEFCLSVSERQVGKFYHVVNSFLAKFFKSLW